MHSASNTTLPQCHRRTLSACCSPLLALPNGPAARQQHCCLRGDVGSRNPARGCEPWRGLLQSTPELCCSHPVPSGGALRRALTLALAAWLRHLRGGCRATWQLGRRAARWLSGSTLLFCCPGRLRVLHSLACASPVPASPEYKLLSKKGEGTFSEVLKATCIKNGKPVAIKCMKNHFDSLDQVCGRDRGPNCVPWGLVLTHRCAGEQPA
jgi:hypothetical protein